MERPPSEDETDRRDRKEDTDGGRGRIPATGGIHTGRPDRDRGDDRDQGHDVSGGFDEVR